ncbi:MAG: hypothetical protein K5767_03390 [Clostridia bacterium]|nr:hypothetical protein [Clostridia bacterium]
MGEVILWGLLAVLVGICLRSIIKSHKSGSCSGCSSEGGCSGSCCSCGDFTELKKFEESLKDK